MSLFVGSAKPGRLVLGWIMSLVLASLSLHAEPPAAVPAPSVDASSPEPPMSPLAKSLRGIVDGTEHPRLKWRVLADVRPVLDALYRPRAYEPIWLRDGKPLAQVAAVVGCLAGASVQGLDPSDYDAEPLQRWLSDLAAQASADDLVLFDTALTIAVSRYARSLHEGRVHPSEVGARFEPNRTHPVDVVTLFRQLQEGSDPASVFASLEPRSLQYRQLKEALQSMRSAPPVTVDRQLNVPKKLVPGERSPEVVKLRAILAASGESVAEPPDAASRELYDPALADAVKRFQARNGLEADGVVGKGTVARLQLSDEDRIQRLRFGLERQRWLPADSSGRQLLVNVPGFELMGFADGLGNAPAEFVMRVIVGQSIDGRRTPLFGADMTYVVFRPHWNLPYKIATKEMLPSALRRPGYLARNNIEVVSSYGGRAAIYAPTRENLARVSSGALKLRQKPGPKNALGLVKFAFPNDDSVYLHSTPNPGLFARARRDFSHGCIRVADPVALAEWILREDPAWNRERIQQAMHGGSSRTVNLAAPVPVTIFYTTVWADAEGGLRFYEDIYAQDAVLRTRFEQGFAPRS